MPTSVVPFEPGPTPVMGDTGEKAPLPILQFHDAMDAVDDSILSLTLQESIYGSAVLAATYTQSKTMLSWWKHCGVAYVFLVVNAFVQGAILVQLYQLVLLNQDTIEKDTDCTAFWPSFFFVYHTLFFTAALTELQDTWDLLSFVQRGIPTVAECCTDSALRYTKAEDGSLEYASGGITQMRKCCIVCLVVVPKMFFAGGLTIIGGWFLQTSATNSDLLLNSLAAVFITDVDEIIYTYFLPATMRHLVESFPPFETEHPGKAYRIWQGFIPVLKLITVVSLTLLFWFTRMKCSVDPCSDSIRSCPLIGTD